MKHYLLLLVVSITVFVSIVSADAINSIKEENPLTVDKVMTIVANAGQFINNERRFVDVINEKLEYSLWVMMISGELDLLDGWVEGLTNFKLRGKVKAVENRFFIPLRFKKLDFTFKYDSRVSYLENNGNLTVYLKNVDITIPLVLKEGKFELDYLPTNKIGDMTLIFSGDRSFRNFFFNLFGDSFHKAVRHLMNSFYKLQLIQAFIEAMNDAKEN